MRSYDTEIISVGTELLLGRITNTDARDISELLSEIGINVKYHSVVGDNPQRLRECVDIARCRADIIITTGGLGPTVDDLTKKILAESFGKELVEDKAERAGLYCYINNGHSLTDNMYQQAMLPEGCTVFHNDWGTAPGCGFEADGKIVLMLPGPPKECVPMFAACAVPYLRRLSDEQIVSHSVRVFGLGESEIDSIFANDMNSMLNPTMAPYAKECDCLLQITAKAKSEAEAEEMIAPVMKKVIDRLGEAVYGVDIETMEEAVFALLKEKNMSFSTAESCTGGEIAERFTAIPGASAYYMGGAVTYTNAVKAELLGIDRDIIEKYGAVSREVAKLMAEGIRERLRTDMAVSVTGLAGPDGDGVHEVGTVFIALAVEGKTYVRETHLGAGRQRGFIRRMAGNHAFDMMRRYMSGLEI